MIAEFWSAEGTHIKALEHFDKDIDCCAIYAADHYYNNNDGWEDKWPVEFTFYDKSETKIGTRLVDMDFEPIFRVIDP